MPTTTEDRDEIIQLMYRYATGRFHMMVNPLTAVDGDSAEAPDHTGAPGRRFPFPIAEQGMASWPFTPEAGGGWQHQQRGN